ICNITMSVAISDTQITLWCFKYRSSSFSVTVENNNSIFDLKKAILEEVSVPDNVKAKDLRLWNIEATFYGVQGNNIQVVVRAPIVTKHPIKKRQIEQGWKSYIASNGHSVELPPQIIDMLESDKFVSDPRTTFRTAFQNIHVGQSITLPHLGQELKHFAEGYQGRTLLITGQMIDIWDKLSADNDYSIKRVLSGPMGMSKSYISYFLASKAYAKEWSILYIADASDLNVESSKKAGDKIEVTIAEEILDLIKLADHKALLIVNEHGESFKFARVILMGTAHARYEREYMKKVAPRSEDIRHQRRGKKVLKKFEIERVDKILVITQKYYNSLTKTEKTHYYNALTSMFLPSKPIVQFEWKFLDLGLIYQYKEGITHYLPLCPSAQKALLKMYMLFDLPENIKNQLRVGSLTREQFEKALFNRLVCKCNTTIQLNTTDLNNNNRNVITLHFNDYDLIKNSQLSLGSGNDKVLGHDFYRYSRFDYMLGPIFIQVSISDFISHNSKSSTNIRKAFELMSALADSQNRFIVTRNGIRVPGFHIVYIRGSPNTPNHSGKVREFPDIAHVTFEEIKSQLFSNIV
ncbi:1173_t:CDS:2, partial [Funneliformis mosseae]